MNARLEQIVESIQKLDYVRIIQPFALIEGEFRGEIAIEEHEVNLKFETVILATYPLQFRNIDTIRFINESLRTYDHVNADGSICIHTVHSSDLTVKIQYDFNALRQWIKKYYLNKEKDNHYEHIVVPEKEYEGLKQVFWFTEVDFSFNKGDFGYFTYSLLAEGTSKEATYVTAIVQGFKVKKDYFRCKWSSNYQSLPAQTGIYYFSGEPPVVNRRFVVEQWVNLEPFVSQDFIHFLYKKERELKGNKEKPKQIPLLIGYKTNEREIHWQTCILETDSFPNYVEKVTGTKTYLGRFVDEEIYWAKTQNCSYQYFFGRGSLHINFTSQRILIIGIGAIGSMVATILVRGGCKNIHLNDYDVKESGNVCRSEYCFSSGTNGKVYDLAKTLVQISPFVEVTVSESLMDVGKMAVSSHEWIDAYAAIFEGYDIIFDCSTDNDVAYILDQLPFEGEIFNLSITNHAKDLVCIIKPGLYRWLMDVFNRIENDTSDLYNPTGCWDPTFKASYNDIAVLVQYAIKQINSCYQSKLSVRNFYLTTSEEQGFHIKLNQF